jgi:hypothetical protein
MLIHNSKKRSQVTYLSFTKEKAPGQMWDCKRTNGELSTTSFIRIVHGDVVMFASHADHLSFEHDVNNGIGASGVMNLLLFVVSSSFPSSLDTSEALSLFSNEFPSK